MLGTHTCRGWPSSLKTLPEGRSKLGWDALVLVCVLTPLLVLGRTAPRREKPGPSTQDGEAEALEGVCSHCSSGGGRLWQSSAGMGELAVCCLSTLQPCDVAAKGCRLAKRGSSAAFTLRSRFFEAPALGHICSKAG